jgi:hypothetical protein
MNVDEAKAILTKLEAHLIAATNKATVLQSERRRVSFKACNGDNHARALLDELNTNSAVAALEIENAKSALDEARSQLAAAEREAAMAEKRQLAEKVLRVTKALEGSGPAIASSLRTLCKELSGFHEALTGLHRLGVPGTNARLIELAFTRTILASLRETALVDVDIIPPGLRSEPEYLVAAYLQAPRKWADEILAADGAEATAVEAA